MARRTLVEQYGDDAIKSVGTGTLIRVAEERHMELFMWANSARSFLESIVEFEPNHKLADMLRKHLAAWPER